MGSKYDSDSEVLGYRSQIQEACRFNDPAGVWEVFELHTSPRAVYKKVAKAAQNRFSANYTMVEFPSRKDYKMAIQHCCRFDEPDKVFSCMDKHKYAEDLYRVLTQGLLNKR